jgi:hypothetical protein
MANETPPSIHGGPLGFGTRLAPRGRFVNVVGDLAIIIMAWGLVEVDLGVVEARRVLRVSLLLN